MQVDKTDAREVAWAQGIEFAKANGCLFVEASALSGAAVSTAFEELVLQIVERGGLGSPDSRPDNVAVGGSAPSDFSSSCMC